MLKTTTVYLKSAPGSSCCSHRRKSARGGVVSAVRRSCSQFVPADGYAGRDGSRVPWFFTITPLFGTVASWGFGVNIHHFWTRDKSGGWEALEQTEQPNKDRRKSWGSLCVQWPTLIIIVWNLFLSYEDYLLLLFFFLFCNFLSKPNMLLISCMLYVWLLRERKLTNKRCQLC